MDLICAGARAVSTRCLLQAGEAEALIGALTILSVVAAAGFGLLGLLTDYRNEANRVTRWGRLAAVGVIGTALLSIMLATLQDGLQAREKVLAQSEARAQRNELAQRFETQLGELGKVRGGLDGVLSQNTQVLAANEVVRSGLRDSIATQRRQLAAANRVVADVANGARQSERSTLRLLQSMWETAQRVSSKDLSLRLTTNCGFAPLMPGSENSAQANRFKSPPTVFEPYVFVKLDILPPTARLDAGRTFAVGSGPQQCSTLLVGHCDEPTIWSGFTEVHRLAGRPRFHKAVGPAATTIKLIQVSTFDNLTGARRGELKALRSELNGAWVNLQLLTQGEEFVGLFSQQDIDHEQFTTFEIYKQRLDGGELRVRSRQSEILLKSAEGLTVLPCEIDAALFVGGTSVGQQQGILVRQGRDIAMLALAPIRIANDAFPVYAPPPGARQPGISSSTTQPAS